MYKSIAKDCVDKEFVRKILKKGQQLVDKSSLKEDKIIKIVNSKI